ncbi:hypothetical protein DFS33DRAFT_1271331 [Desarmillaria ectypa]|nr:hypothetical protein DFS33DRAFT_1271331 [Desarmillaria ectypa]
MCRLLEIGWMISTFCQAQMTNTTQMCAIRALVWLFETHLSIERVAVATGLATMIYLTGAWYKDDEVGRRIALINTATAVGPMCSSSLQAAICRSLNGRFGHTGWQWLFYIDGIISVVVIILQLFLLPDVPARQKPNGMFTAAIRTWFLRPEVLLLWLMSWCNSVWGYNNIKKDSLTCNKSGRRWPPLCGAATLNLSMPVFAKHRASRWFLCYNTGWIQSSSLMFWAWTQDMLLNVASGSCTATMYGFFSSGPISFAHYTSALLHSSKRKSNRLLREAIVPDLHSLPSPLPSLSR